MNRHVYFHRNSLLASRTLLGVMLALLIEVHACTGQCPTYTPSQGGNVQSSAIIEASGLTSSRRTPGYYYTHNDNTNDQRVFAVAPDGSLRGTWNIVSSSNVRDPEDIAVGPGPIAGETYLYLADTGDNSNVRTDIAVYRALEPSVPASGPAATGNLNADKIRLAYPDGPRDAETLMVDSNGDIYVVVKRLTPGKVYRAAYPQSTTAVNLLEHVGQLPWGLTQPTGGDIAADGSAIVIRGYFNISIWDRMAGADIGTTLSSGGCAVQWVLEEQGEAVCFEYESLDYVTLSEGSNKTLNFFERFIPAPNIGDFVNAVLFSPNAQASIDEFDFNEDGQLDGLDVAGLIEAVLGS